MTTKLRTKLRNISKHLTLSNEDKLALLEDLFNNREHLAEQLVEALKTAKPNDASERDRDYEVIITDAEKLHTLIERITHEETEKSKAIWEETMTKEYIAIDVDGDQIGTRTDLDGAVSEAEEWIRSRRENGFTIDGESILITQVVAYNTCNDIEVTSPEPEKRMPSDSSEFVCFSGDNFTFHEELEQAIDEAWESLELIEDAKVGSIPEKTIVIGQVCRYYSAESGHLENVHSNQKR